jgi:hypothetical protein
MVELDLPPGKINRASRSRDEFFPGGIQDGDLHYRTGRRHLYCFADRLVIGKIGSPGRDNLDARASSRLIPPG